MNNKEINFIISNYKPHEGFIDLSQKPEILIRKEYAKILRIQDFLVCQSENKEYLKMFEPIQYEKVKEVSARYQIIISEYWEKNGRII